MLPLGVSPCPYLFNLLKSPPKVHHQDNTKRITLKTHQVNPYLKVFPKTRPKDQTQSCPVVTYKEMTNNHCL
ncbi:hypothetical protein [Shigella phage ESh6]|nr:hypothetical protein [Shigella phage ESh6]